MEKILKIDTSTEKPASLVKKTKSRLLSLIKFKNIKSDLLEEVVELIDDHDPGGEKVGGGERNILNNVLEIRETTVSDVMVPRLDIVAAPFKANFDELKEILIEKEHTRIPVYKESLDNVVGFIHIKDMFPFLGGERGKKPFAVSMILREILFVPPSMKVIDLLVKMQAKRVHVAIVLDEYGGTDGLVTMEDLVEEIVGDIEDEHDIGESSTIKNIDENSMEVAARISIAELEEKLGINITDKEQEADFDTLGGLIFYMLGYVPKKGEIIKHPAGIEFEVLEADARRITKLLVRKV